jgi:hypothetical protein
VGPIGQWWGPLSILNRTKDALIRCVDANGDWTMDVFVMRGPGRDETLGAASLQPSGNEVYINK